jgi:predicted PurR-regulated permease PerM
MADQRVPLRLLAPDKSTDGLVKATLGLVIAALIIGFLYVGKEAFVPLVVAALLAFILEPAIRSLRTRGMGKVTSVALVVIISIGSLGALGYIMAHQVAQLADRLPAYETNLRTKLQELKGKSLSSSALEKASDTLRSLNSEISKPKTDKLNAPLNVDTGALSNRKEPVTVEVVPAKPETFEALQKLVHPLVSPLATTGLIILFLLFILIQREDLRDRFVRVLGAADLRASTEAMNDAAARLSRLFLVQAGLNLAFGVVIALGLFLIGVPNAVLWGMLAAIMRFVPYIGAVISAVFPIALAAAVDPGWTMVVETTALFVVGEIVAGQIIEPMLFGHHTGLSPLAVVVTTLFWTLLWGPIGLLLATPLTVCLVVMGKHIEALQFVEVLLGDEPALTPPESFYQRILAGDGNEAADNAEKILKTISLSEYYSTVAMKGLALAQTDANRGKLTAQKQLEISATIKEIVVDLSDYKDVVPEEVVDAAVDTTIADDKPARLQISPVLEPGDLLPDWKVEYPIVCIAGRSALDEAAAIMLAHLLEAHGVGSRVQGPLAAASGPSAEILSSTQVVCISYFGGATSQVTVRYLIRRLRRLMPNAIYVAGFWAIEVETAKAEQWRAGVGADVVATSLEDVVAACVKLATSPPLAATTTARPPVSIANNATEYRSREKSVSTPPLSSREPR